MRPFWKEYCRVVSQGFETVEKLSREKFAEIGSCQEAL
jgi:hypothetical protein